MFRVGKGGEGTPSDISSSKGAKLALGIAKGKQKMANMVQDKQQLDQKAGKGDKDGQCTGSKAAKMAKLDGPVGQDWQDGEHGLPRQTTELGDEDSASRKVLFNFDNVSPLDFDILGLGVPGPGLGSPAKNLRPWAMH